MSIENINNLESASSIRAKLNEMIKIINDYSSSQYVGSPTPPDGGGYTPPPGGGGSYNSLTIYDSDGVVQYPVGHDTFAAACMAYPGAPKTIYYSKGGANVGAGLEVGDNVYSDSNGTTPLQSMKYYGYQEYGMNKAFFVAAGSVSELNFCA